MVGYLLLFVLFSTNFIVFDNNKAITKTYEGYVITELEDTLYGKLEMLSPTMNQVKVKFIDKDDKRITYKAKELKAYAFEAEIWNRKEKRNVQEWIFYTKKTVERPPIPFRGNDILMQHEVRGNINMYNYYVETRTSQTMEHLVYIDKEGVLYDISQKNYRKILKSLMGDYPVVYHKIGTKGYTFKFLSKIIKEYNQQSLKQGDRIMTVDRN